MQVPVRASFPRSGFVCGSFVPCFPFSATAVAARTVKLPVVLLERTPDKCGLGTLFAKDGQPAEEEKQFFLSFFLFFFVHILVHWSSGVVFVFFFFSDVVIFHFAPGSCHSASQLRDFR